MRTIEELRLLPVWVNPDHMVSTALHVMRGHRLASLPVVEDGRLLGVVHLEVLARAPETEPVARWVEKPSLTMPSYTEAKRAAAIFVQEGATHVPVVQDDRFMGLLTSNILLEELGRSWDPLTNLSWSDQLREWGMDRLKDGQEIAILFLDIDDFGNYNKKYGHIVGDRILQIIASRLREFARGERDVLVRFGGDEFAIGLVQTRDQAELVKSELQSLLRRVELDGVAEPVSVSVGLSGGKRTKERENTHFAATVDSLINLASKDCMAAKKRSDERKRIGGPDIDARVVEVAVDEDGNAPTVVVLSIRGSSRAGLRTRKGESNVESVALATARALERSYESVRIEIEDVSVTDNGRARVSIAGRCMADGDESALSASRTVGDDLYAAAAHATLDAFARAGCRAQPAED